ncbi:MAG: CotH kinase family protein [Bacteroidota bacterium]
MKNLILAILLFFGLSSSSQNGSLVFNDSVLHTLKIETDLPNWFETLEQDFQNNFSNPEIYPEIYRKCKVTWDGMVYNECGFREKGNASNTLTNFGKKKPFKISFDEFLTNQTLDGLKKINLNNFTNDPSLLHDAIAFKLFRDAGLLASRTSYTKLWINGEYIGLYIAIENVDKTFLKSKFGSKGNDGNLYKTDRGASVPLNWLGPESAGYKKQGLKLTTNETKDDWSKLTSFIDMINNDHSPDFKQKLESRFDVHAYLKVLAIEKCIRSWDSYCGGGNNFYLYDHPDGKIRWIPWDMNETFQDIKVLSGTSLLDGYLVPANKFDVRPLLKRIFEVEEWKNEYLNYACHLVQTNYTLDHLGSYILERHNLIADAYRDDPYKVNSYSSFEHSLTEYNEDVVSLTHSAYVLRINYPGIYPFIQSQREWVVKQLGGWDRECSIKDNSIYNLFVYPNPVTDHVNISNEVSGFDYAQFKLYDFTGRLCLNTKYDLMQGDYYTLQLGEIPSGIYLLIKISADGKIGRAKLIVR